jgi:hypothetical protein
MKINCTDQEFRQLLRENPGAAYYVRRGVDGQLTGNLFKRSPLWLAMLRAQAETTQRRGI